MDRSIKRTRMVFHHAALTAILTLAGCGPMPETQSNQNSKGEMPKATSEIQKTGGISISSAPPGAQIMLMLVDEGGVSAPQPRGSTPATVTDLSPGKYTVHLEKTGYQYFQKQIEVKSGEVTEVKATLKKS